MNEKLAETFKLALDFEDKGYQMYSEAAKTTPNPFVETTFIYLAEQEQKHMEDIKKYVEDNQIEMNGDSIDETKDFFRTTIEKFREQLKSSDEDMHAYETAMELEKKGYEFYKEQYENAEDEEVKKFFKFLMEQENTHYTLIEKGHAYMKDPVSFFSTEEDWFFEG